MRNKIRNEIEKSIKVKESILNDLNLLLKIENLALEVIKSIENKGKIIFCGNGGSFADSQHLAAEFVSRLRIDREPLPAIALGTNSSNLTAIGNDYGFNKVFSRELNSLGRKEDLFIPISTSGKSQNIIEAVKFSKSIGIKVIGLTGSDGGELINHCHVINIPSIITEKIQESHIMIGHIVCYLVEQKLFENNDI